MKQRIELMPGTGEPDGSSAETGPFPRAVYGLSNAALGEMVAARKGSGKFLRVGDDLILLSPFFTPEGAMSSHAGMVRYVREGQDEELKVLLDEALARSEQSKRNLRQITSGIQDGGEFMIPSTAERMPTGLWLRGHSEYFGPAQPVERTITLDLARKILGEDLEVKEGWG